MFLLGVPVMVLLLIAGPLLLPEYRNPDAGRLDLVSVALSLAAILPIIWGIKDLTTSDADSPGLAFGVIAVGLAIGVVFARRQLRLADPLLDLQLLAQPAIRVLLPAMVIGSGALAGTSLMTTQYTQSVEGLSPTESGIWQAPTSPGSPLRPPRPRARRSRPPTPTTGRDCSMWPARRSPLR